MLVKHKESQDELKELFGPEYFDYGLVFATTNGRPVEGQIINRAFHQLIVDNDLPHVVFHSLRHSSITYKLKLNGGDIKAVQGDSGHAQAKMVTDQYSHILDDDRRVNAQRLEDAFYASRSESEEEAPVVEDKEENKVTEVDVEVTEQTQQQADQELLLKLLANPEMAALLKTLAKNL